MNFRFPTGVFFAACVLSLSGCAVQQTHTISIDIADIEKVVEAGVSEGFVVYKDANGNTISPEQFRTARQTNKGYSYASYALFGKKVLTRIALLPKVGS